MVFQGMNLWVKGVDFSHQSGLCREVRKQYMIDLLLGSFRYTGCTSQFILDSFHLALAWVTGIIGCSYTGHFESSLGESMKAARPGIR